MTLITEKVKNGLQTFSDSSSLAFSIYVILSSRRFDVNFYFIFIFYHSGCGGIFQAIFK